MLENKKNTYQKEDEDKKKADEAKDFLAWLQNFKFQEDNTKKKDEKFDQWFHRQKASDISNYRKQWVEHYRSTGAITENIAQLLVDNAIGSGYNPQNESAYTEYITG